MVDTYSKWLEVIPMKTATALTTVKDCGDYSQDLEYQIRLSQTMAHNLLQKNFKNSAGEISFDTSLLHTTTWHQTVRQNEVCKHSRKTTRHFLKGLWKIVYLDLCCNMPSRHTKPLDVVHRSYCSEESYSLVWILSNRTLESLLNRNNLVRRSMT